MMSENFRVTRADEGKVSYGLISVIAVRGLIVTRSYDAQGNEIFTPATGTRGAHLERDVVAAIPLENVIFGKDFVHPEKVGAVVTGRYCQEIEAEGSDLIQTSGTGAISNATALNTELGCINGKLRVRQSGDELHGYLRGIKPAEGDGTFRIVVEENE